MKKLGNPSRLSSSGKDGAKVLLQRLHVLNRRGKAFYTLLTFFDSLQSRHCVFHEIDRADGSRQSNSHILVQNMEPSKILPTQWQIHLDNELKEITPEFAPPARRFRKCNFVDYVKPTGNSGICFNNFGVKVRSKKSGFAPSCVLSLCVHGRCHTICGTTHHKDCIGGNGSHDDTRTCEHDRPSVPPNHAILAQPPALAHAIQHAHSLIPPWIGRHFAMGAGITPAARPLGVK